MALLRDPRVAGVSRDLLWMDAAVIGGEGRIFVKFSRI